MKLLGYEFQDILDRAENDGTHLFECGEDCGSFDNALLNMDDAPQCPQCLSFDLLYEASDIVALMERDNGEGLDRMTIRGSVGFRNKGGLK